MTTVLNYGKVLWYIFMATIKEQYMQHETQKITAHLPKDLLESAQKASGKGITETLRAALQSYTRAQAYEGLLALRGKVDLGLTAKDLKELRQDKPGR